jgi:kynurenine formamidase
MEAAEYLISKEVAALAVDTLSPDPPHVRHFARRNLIGVS